jgi:serine/threonine-protein kinase RsbW
MTDSSRNEREIRLNIPATLGALEEMIAEFRRRCAAVLPCGEAFVTELLLRELATNAVRHGCQEDPALWVRCSVRVHGRRLTIAVADDGAGFDWRTVRNHEPDPDETFGRGMQICRHYSTRVRFNRRGNSVVIIRNFC